MASSKKYGAMLAGMGLLYLVSWWRITNIPIELDVSQRAQAVKSATVLSKHHSDASGGLHVRLNQFLGEPKQIPTKAQQGSSTSSASQPFLDYQLHFNEPYNLTYEPFTQCHVGIITNKWGRKPIERVPLSPEFVPILNVTTTIQTNLRILSLGDSVGIQFHQLLEEAAGARAKDRRLYEFAWGEHESVSIAAPIQGGGLLGAFRMTGMLLESGRGKPPPNQAGGGWLPSHVEELLNHTYIPQNIESEAASNKRVPVEAFDAMILRIPHGWLKLKEITESTLTETIRMAHKLFGITTVIVLTLPLNNNVESEDELEELAKTNGMIQTLVESWNAQGETQETVPRALHLDFGSFANDLTRMNARLAGMVQTPPNYVLKRLGCSKYPPSLAMICTDAVKPGSCTCKRNLISIDGLHWCMESVGGRVLAGIACLLQCSLAHDPHTSRKDLRNCEGNCNARFMSLDPIL